MINNIDIIYAVAGQSLAFDAPEGQPSSITSSTVFENRDGDDDTAELATTGTAAISAISTTFNLPSGDSEQLPRKLSLADTAGIEVGKRYIATDATGQVEAVEIVAVAAGLSATSRHALRNDYISGDTFEGTEITHALDTTWVSEKNNISNADPAPRYRWRLEYVVGGVTYVHAAYFDLVRESGSTTVTGMDVDAAYPWLGWLNKLDTDDQGDLGARIISEAYRQVKLELAMAGKADEAARNREVIEDLVIHRSAELVAGVDIDAVEVIRTRYSKAFDNFVIVGKLEFDSDGSGSADISPSVPIGRR